MHDVHGERLYMQRRAQTSSHEARAAIECCARIVHETLARLYGERARALLRPSWHETPARIELAYAPQTLRMAEPSSGPFRHAHQRLRSAGFE